MGSAYAAHIDAMDTVFSGPALISFPAFIGACLAGRRPASGAIDGVLSGAASGGSEPRQGEARDINTPVRLDYGPFLDAFERAFPEREMRPALLFETSRGCYWAEKQVCTFCGLNGLQRHYRSMTPANAIQQIQSLYRWAPRCGSFIAVDTAMPRDYVSTVFPALAVPDGVKLMYEVRPDLKDSELAAMCAGGVGALQPGIESLSSASLKLMHKGTTAFSNLRFLKACSCTPLALDWNLLIGSPGEAESVCRKLVRDIPRLTHLAPPSGVYPIMFVRHSRYFDDPPAYDLELEPQDFYALTYPFEASVIREIATHFVDRNTDAEAIDGWLARLNEAVRQWRARWLGGDGQPQARLCLLEGAGPGRVYDSRAGQEVEHDLSGVAQRILEQLERPARVADLAEALGDVPGDLLQAEMEGLVERGWVFEEEGRYLNLVIL